MDLDLSVLLLSSTSSLISSPDFNAPRQQKRHETNCELSRLPGLLQKAFLSGGPISVPEKSSTLRSGWRLRQRIPCLSKESPLETDSCIEDSGLIPGRRPTALPQLFRPAPESPVASCGGTSGVVHSSRKAVCLARYCTTVGSLSTFVAFWRLEQTLLQTRCAGLPTKLRDPKDDGSEVTSEQERSDRRMCLAKSKVQETDVHAMAALHDSLQTVRPHLSVRCRLNHAYGTSENCSCKPTFPGRLLRTAMKSEGRSDSTSSVFTHSTNRFRKSSEGKA